MSGESIERRLAAMLSADAVGYTRLMAEDEVDTVRTLKSYRDLIGRLVQRHRGRVVDAPGDNVLAEFPSATGAVRCALEMQEQLAGRNAALPEARRMPFRIGIHLGEVMVDGDKVYGDGVNIAARLEALAESGSICVSQLVHAQVRRKLGISFEDLGEHRLKNVSEPVHVWRIAVVSSDGEPPKTVQGRYEIVRFLGEGARKRVFLAHDGQLGREVALSLLKTEGLDERGRERFRREVQAAAKLGDHPNLVTVFDADEEDGQPFVVSEYVRGGDLLNLLERSEGGRLPCSEALRVGADICAGLARAHQDGIIHRDLKPANVWMDDAGRAKVGDFGLAHVGQSSRITDEGTMIGTAAYMAPEQALGGEVSVRSDLYAFGAVLYEMLTGRPPFEGDDAIGVISQHLNSTPVAPSRRNGDIRPELDQLVLQLLAKDPAQRPKDATAVQQALSSIDQVSPTPPKSATTGAAPDAVYQRVFTGRAQERKQLEEAFERARSGGGALCMVVGEPGIGKTSLCEQLATYARIRGGRVLQGQCYEEGSFSIPYLPFVEALQSHLESREESVIRDELGSGAVSVAQILPELVQRLAVEPAPEGESQAARYRLFRGIADWIRAIGEKQPLVMILEDLHDADGGTLELLGFIARQLEGTPVLLVATYRDVEVDRAHPLSKALSGLRRTKGFARLALRGLEEPQVARILERVIGHSAPQPITRSVHRATEGNPLFVQEVGRHLVESGLLAGTAQLDESEITAQIPEGLRDVVGRRLSRLSEECNRLLSLAAVIGRDFRLDTLAAVAEGAEEQIGATLEEAVGVAVLDERVEIGGVRYRFAHAFFRQTLYEELSAPRRIRTHQKVGRVLEEQYAAALDDHAAELAEHFAHSSSPEELEKARHYSDRAAERAAAVYAFAEAARHLERLLELQELTQSTDPRLRWNVLFRLGWAYYSSGNFEAVMERVAPEAYRLAENLCDPRRAALSAFLPLWAMQRFNPGLVYSPEAQRWIERADRHAAPGSLQRVYADMFLTYSVALSHGVAATTPILRRALDTAESLANDDAIWHVRGFFFSRMSPETHGEVTRVLEASLAAYRTERARSGGPGDELTSGSSDINRNIGLFNAAHVLYSVGRPTEARELAESAAAHASRVGDPGGASLTCSHKAFLLAAGGDLAGAVRLCEEHLAESEERGQLGSAYASPIGEQLHTWNMLLGRDEQARFHFVKFIELYGDGARAIPWRQLRSFVLAGRREEAGELLGHLVDQGQLGSGTYAPGLVASLEAALWLENEQAVRTIAQSLAPLADLAVLYREAVTPGRLLGAAAAWLGQPEEARELYERGLAAAKRIPFRPEIALIRLGLGELLLAHFPDRAAEAREHLDFAVEECRDMKMQPALRRAEALLAPSTASAPIAPIANEAPDRGIFRHEGDFWTLGFGGLSCRLKDQKGLHDIARLLRQPGEELHVLELATNQTPNAPRAQGSAGPALDEQAKREYRRRLAELRDSIEQAEQWNDTGRAEQRRAELEAFTKELAGAVGIGGRDRASGSDAERARAAVTQRIRVVLKRIEREIPSLAHHLSTAIKTGTFCSYRPAPDDDLRWDI